MTGVSFGRYRFGSTRTSTGTRLSAASPSSTSRILRAVPRADVVDDARAAPVDDVSIRAHRVADIRQIAHRIEVADFDDRRYAALLNQRDLFGEGRRGKRRILPRPDVVERTREEHLLAVLIDAALSQHLLRKLAEGVRAGRSDGIVLTQCAIRLPVHIRRTRNEHARVTRPLSEDHRAGDGCRARSWRGFPRASLHDCPTCAEPAQ